METERLILRAFTPDDWRDLQELAIDWRAAPGPEFDKWPTEEAACQGFARYLSARESYYAVVLRDTGKLIGLLALNGIDASKQFDLGHVIHSRCQDNDLDREALGAMVDCIFRHQDVLSIVTRNWPDHAGQLAPLQSLGFRARNEERKGELVLLRQEWEHPGSDAC